MPQASGFDATCIAHIAGLRRRMRLLCLPQETAAGLVEVVKNAGLDFPGGFSLEHEGPYPVRYEATAPYTAASAYLPAALARVVKGPLLEVPPDNFRCDSAEQRDPSQDRRVRLVVLESTMPVTREAPSGRLFMLAEDRPLPSSHAFCSLRFCNTWRARPFPDYSAALEPLAALALVSLGLRVHASLQRKDQRPERPATFLDPTCGTGTLAAAARYCVPELQVFAGDVSGEMTRRTGANLEKTFLGSAAERLDGDVAAISARCGNKDRVAEFWIRQWDASHRWPFPSFACAGTDGSGLLVASNLPWGRSLGGQEEDAARIVQCLASEFPRATLCLIVPWALVQEATEQGWLQVIHAVPAGKKAAILIARGSGT